MRISIVIDEALITEAFNLSGVKTKKDLIRQALNEFIANRKRHNLLNLGGKIQFSEGYDYKKMRGDV
jgi:Arc/MetJ family transcription regulator